MKTRKGRWIVQSALAVILATVMTACSLFGGGVTPTPNGGGDHVSDIEQTAKEAKTINESSKLGLELYALSKLSAEDARQYGPDHPETTESKDGKAVGYYFEYPYKSGERRLTQIYLRSNVYNLFGLKVGDALTTIDSVMEAKGYKKSESKEAQVYTKAHVYLKFSPDGSSGKIGTILISVSDPATPVVMD